MMSQDVLKFITCGSVDDGKSTLIGRMLYESDTLLDDQVAELKASSKKFGTTGDDIDYSLLVDGLVAEREQGITIDIAYRYFKTSQRRFIVADTPGHIQYTRNMATAASNSDLAVILIDARHGVLPQTKRHSYVVSMLGVRHIIVAINKMDLMGYSQEVFEKVTQDYKAFCKDFGFDTIDFVPVSALKGDNICTTSDSMSWYSGSTLFSCLENAKVSERPSRKLGFRMPVQSVNRPNLDFRGFMGTIASGQASVGQEVVALPSGNTSKIKSIMRYKDALSEAKVGEAVTITLEDEVDISRGDMIADVAEGCPVSDVFRCKILWMVEKPMVPGRQYLFKSATSEQICTLHEPKNLIDVETLQNISGDKLMLNDIGVCELYLNNKCTYDRYENSRKMGSFILIDRHSNQTVAMGMIQFAPSRSVNIRHQALTINRKNRAEQKEQKPFAIWMTGLSGSGKSTIADLVEQKLFSQGHHTIILDGDNIRGGLNKDLGFTEQARAENIRRIAEVTKLMMDAGLIVIVSFISPFREERELAKQIIGAEGFLEVFIDTPLEVAEKRDVKGLYAKARAGRIPNFTGIDSPYEEPIDPDISVQTANSEPDECAEQVLEYLLSRAITS